MNGAGLFLFLSAVVLLSSAHKWDNYDSFNKHLKTHIDKAIVEANMKFSAHRRHINFHRLVGRLSVTSQNYFVNVMLLPTICAKNETELRQRKDCPFQAKPTMVINCVVCSRRGGTELVNCVKHLDVKKSKEIRAECSDDHNTGGASILSLKTSHNEQPFGCIGCV
ncbi:cystatin-like protein [Electrophorus electricus]|uniref:cystatin-like protein n=1 Tax=Electrophorus electricus TaxID=8005 RepID=UPI0015D083A6|nr:cystatin-like protein [Electrophorus electricus]